MFFTSDVLPSFHVQDKKKDLIHERCSWHVNTTAHLNLVLVEVLDSKTLRTCRCEISFEKAAKIIFWLEYLYYICIYGHCRGINHKDSIHQTVTKSVTDYSSGFGSHFSPAAFTQYICLCAAKTIYIVCNVLKCCKLLGLASPTLLLPAMQDERLQCF